MVAVCSNANVDFFERNPALDIPAALLDLDGVTAAAVLHTLEDSRFLERTRNGRHRDAASSSRANGRRCQFTRVVHIRLVFQMGTSRWTFDLLTRVGGL